jgi:hypothetical protein
MLIIIDNRVGNYDINPTIFSKYYAKCLKEFEDKHTGWTGTKNHTKFYYN